MSTEKRSYFGAGVPQQPVEAVLRHADAHVNASLDRLFQLLRIPSISCDALYAPQCREAASWVANELSGIGFDASVRPTIGNPMVVGHHKKADGPHVLFYGHYDVQPAEPFEAWQANPFEPTLKTQPDGDTHIVARGASDDKGQLLTFIEACRSWKAVTGGLPISVSMFFEGEEESESPSMESFLDQFGYELAADVMLLCDTYLWKDTVPAITAMFRGIVEEEIEIRCAFRDLHSGAYGNAARNPIQTLAELIASLRGANGEVTIEGFYDDIEELDEEVRSQLLKLNFAADAFLRDAGLSQSAGDASYSVLEQIWTRPSCEINGIAGGYYGDGVKTIIPSRAVAKISFRLVPGQNPEKIQSKFRAHIRARTPVDCKVEFKGHGGSPAWVISPRSHFLASARAALKQEWGCEPVLIGSGGSIPIVGVVKHRLGLESLPIGFARSDNRHHSPNEKYDLSSFQKGIRSWIRILAEFSIQRRLGQKS
ncbi:M20/M25/M40 family metallo-hydrolase [Mesorhizobium sp. M4A.F.Ca.ET.022.05.2.1]|uniref:M20/M25/M40 family metallo-hydrolase n=1 Tax=Mesorhizobium sp. M4A.F.Ca.ET.022.05.2.1 TaxID=2496653 RepID=UPI000FCBA759|nr:M20/M25/M40 family metallo-hydrolase [Mesorhizobium sp. M4A.F.Ca.ET.022.05.2.1]RVC84016.1 M20/M25/M40 family metallo-hydrolase [Mesorhizobium sp. M4A.F.Ca.ET.022.05.2.1]